ncbi:3,4-dihydroxy-2-butanone-4-phosphate synthase [Flavobacteriaceae bacterium]|nr:3,4-dihydroxy-2-butanone-4-phosphate synthase [Flavobacteriaceae bacterium]
MMNDKIKLNSIPEAIEAIRQGKVVIVVDDEDRENEGDFVAAAELVNPEMINFMATHGRGLICTPLTEDRCDTLKLDMMVDASSDPLQTAFTVSVDLNGKGVTTGISASDRAITIKALTEKETTPYDLRRPGHIFPLKAKNGGVLRRTGHTEAAIDLARLAGLQPAGVIVEIMNEDGTMARLPELVKIAEKYDLKLISIEALVAYRMKHDSLIEKIQDFNLDTRFGTFRLRAYKQTTTDQIHLALTKGSWTKDEDVLVRVNAHAQGNDVLGALLQKKEDKLSEVMDMINKEGKGAVVFINQEKQRFNLEDRLRYLKAIQKDADAPKPIASMDDKDFGVGAQILHDLDITNLKLITKSDQSIKKRVGIQGYGLSITEYISY